MASPASAWMSRKCFDMRLHLAMLLACMPASPSVGNPALRARQAGAGEGTRTLRATVAAAGTPPRVVERPVPVIPR